MSEAQRPGFLERALRPLGDVRAGEGTTAVLTLRGRESSRAETAREIKNAAKKGRVAESAESLAPLD